MSRPMSSLLGSSLLLLGRTRAPAGTPVDQPEAQRAGDRRRLDEFDRDRIAKAVGRGTADESAASFVKTKVLLADAARRNKAIGAGFIELDEQTGARHPGNMPVENCTDAIGVATDRRGKMGIAAQIEAEMAEIIRRIFSLRLRAQHHFIDQPLDVAAFHPRQNPVEAVGTKRAALWQRDVERG